MDRRIQAWLSEKTDDVHCSLSDSRHGFLLSVVRNNPRNNARAVFHKLRATRVWKIKGLRYSVFHCFDAVHRARLYRGKSSGKVHHQVYLFALANDKLFVPCYACNAWKAGELTASNLFDFCAVLSDIFISRYKRFYRVYGILIERQSFPFHGYTLKLSFAADKVTR